MNQEKSKEVIEEEVESELEATESEIQEQQEDQEDNKLEKLLEEKEKENIELNNKYQRLQADFINFKKRTEKEKSDIYLYAAEDMALELLGIIDGLERAIDSQKEETSFGEGIKMILKQLKDILHKHGIKEIEAMGQPFDLNFHHAVMKEEYDGEKDIVIEVFQKGYTIHKKVLRPAMVKVSE
ncbi:nucleotide exchange factor GrpE [Serpentinicella sp. ANB-PHB4]|uniref:nucleotide exchange factor GrpE n=1 Tax=Serpentinicella sp. ANB-PHB4 TaxID=3074076 RepID=UPI0028589AF3|nr:nucleotide exchange factor GrpE [Serpentinicella sp. ANB-PHB4]MDR5657969.1 nucleotide exchange factor GrpE [Serpentinicella sp. ANB-PHB4]